jgi:aminoglycoside phosphotransferase (APT) family kinase protein
MSVIHDPTDLPSLTERAAEAASAIAPSAAVGSVEPLSGGHSSLTYSALLHNIGTADRRIVLKVAPRGVAPVQNRDVLRQARLIRSLANVSGVAVPEILFESPGDPPEIPPFFAMGYVGGDSIEPLVDASASVPGETLAERALAAARMLGGLHAVDIDAIGCGDEPRTELGAEVERWCRAFESVDDGLRLYGPEVGARLAESVPRAGPGVLVHGDYRLGNMRCEGSSIRAVLDWEIWSVGDGRADLAWFLLMLDPGYVPRRHGVAELPSADTLRRAYEACCGGGPVVELAWFHAFVRFKQAATTALITKRARRHGGEGFPETIANLLASAKIRLDEQPRD